MLPASPLDCRYIQCCFERRSPYTSFHGTLHHQSGRHQLPRFKKPGPSWLLRHSCTCTHLVWFDIQPRLTLNCHPFWEPVQKTPEWRAVLRIFRGRESGLRSFTGDRCGMWAEKLCMAQLANFPYRTGSDASPSILLVDTVTQRPMTFIVWTVATSVSLSTVEVGASLTYKGLRVSKIPLATLSTG